MCLRGKGFYMYNINVIIFDSTIFDSTIFSGPLFLPAGKCCEDSNGDDCEGYGDDTILLIIDSVLEEKG